MREGMIICPKFDNNGNPQDETAKLALRNLVKQFGGCTMRDATGYWQSPNTDTLHQEPVWELMAAYEPSKENDIHLMTVAMLVGVFAKQESVYTRYADGRVEIIDTRPVEMRTEAAA
jgi:hypothetical protein